MDASESVSYVEKLNWENLMKFLMYKVKFLASLTMLAGLKKMSQGDLTFHFKLDIDNYFITCIHCMG